MNSSYLFDSQFLKELDYKEDKDLFARITSLTINDYPIEQIEGRITDGSINIDGASALRRSCSLNLQCALDDTTFTDQYWCYNTKFKLEIGVENKINPDYPDIIWFAQGVYIISSFSRSIGTSSISISIQGKDKMSRLNGEISGNLPISTDFGVLEEVDLDGNTTYTKLPIRTIIQQAVREYGQERPENIIINDLEDYGYELWDYRGNEPMYLFIQPGTEVDYPQVINFTLENETLVYLGGEDLKIIENILLHIPENYVSEKNEFFDNTFQTLDSIEIQEVEQETEIYETTKILIDKYYTDLWSSLKSTTTMSNPMVTNDLTKLSENIVDKLNLFEQYFSNAEDFTLLNVVSELFTKSAEDGQYTSEYVNMEKQAMDHDEIDIEAFKELISYQQIIKDEINETPEFSIIDKFAEAVIDFLGDNKDIVDRYTNARERYLEQSKALDQTLKEYVGTEPQKDEEIIKAFEILKSNGKELYQSMEEYKNQYKQTRSSLLGYITRGVEQIKSYWKTALQTIDTTNKELAQIDNGKAPLKHLPEYYSFNTLDKANNKNATKVYFSKPEEGQENAFYYVAKIEYGETAGYHQTELIYHSDLILNAGETVVSLLDKIVTMLGNFEYFYNLEGQLVFQKKKTYQWDAITPVNKENNAIIPVSWFDEYSYRFEDLKLITQLSNSPNITEIKNDFSIWGQKNNTSKVPVHARYAIDKKPTSYNSISYFTKGGTLSSTYQNLYEKIEKDGYSEVYLQNLEKDQVENIGNSYYIVVETKSKIHPSDTLIPAAAVKTTADTIMYYNVSNRIIYKIQEGEEIEITFEEGIKDNTQSYYIKTIGDEIYAPCYLCYIIAINEVYNKFTTSNYDWQEIIYMMAKDYSVNNHNPNLFIEIEKLNPECVGGITGYEQYYSDVLGYWRTLYSPNPTQHEIDMNGEYYDENGSKRYWTKHIHQDPSNLVFWFDFLDSGGEIEQYSIKNIGRRSKTVNETSINSIYFKETPEIQFIVSGENVEQDDGYIPFKIQESVRELFVISSQGNSAMDKINSLLYSHTSVPESINITALPIYYLEPNTRIYLKGYGDYALSKISYSLKSGGTMTLTGTKIIKEFI